METYEQNANQRSSATALTNNNKRIRIFWRETTALCNFCFFYNKKTTKSTNFMLKICYNKFSHALLFWLFSDISDTLTRRATLRLQLVQYKIITNLTQKERKDVIPFYFSILFLIHLVFCCLVYTYEQKIGLKYKNFIAWR